MTTFDILAELKRLNIKVTLDEDKLQLDAPTGALSPELKKVIRQQKPALVALLEAQEARQLLETQGWVAVYSKVLGELVLWLEHENVVIPSRWSRVVRYTLAEVRLLTKNPALDADGLRRLHMAKKMFQGKVKAVIP